MFGITIRQFCPFSQRFLAKSRAGLVNPGARPPQVGALARETEETTPGRSPLGAHCPVVVWTVADLADPLHRPG